jgi:hypothetical protein
MKNLPAPETETDRGWDPNKSTAHLTIEIFINGEERVCLRRYNLTRLAKEVTDRESLDRLTNKVIRELIETSALRDRLRVKLNHERYRIS